MEETLEEKLARLTEENSKLTETVRQLVSANESLKIEKDALVLTIRVLKQQKGE